MIGGFSHMFATMFGSLFLSQAVKTTGSKMAKSFSKRAYKALVRIEKAELSRPGDNYVTQSVHDRAISRASKTHKNFMSEIRGFKRRLDTSIDGAIPKQLNSALGKVFHMGGPSKAFTQHAKEFAVNELITMPIMYSMYRNDKSNYPEMQNQSFLNYYSSTLPFSVGFMAATSSSKLFQRRLKGNLVNKLKNNPNLVRRSVHVAGLIGSTTTKVFSKIGNIQQEVKREAFADQPIKDLFSISGASNFGRRVMMGARKGFEKKQSYFGNDSDSIIHTTRLATERINIHNRSSATKILSQNFNKMIGREGKIMSFVNKIVPSGTKVEKSIDTSITGDFAGLLKDRGIWSYQGKEYDTRVFHLDKMRDIAAESLDRFNVGIGSARLHPFKVITSGMNFLKSDFSRNLNSTLAGGKTTSVASTFFAQVARETEKTFQDGMTEEEKLRKYFSNLIKGPNVDKSTMDSFTDAYVDSFKKGHADPDKIYQGLNNNFRRGFLGLNENSLFYVDSNKTGNIILGNGKNVTLHNTSFAFGTTDNKSTIASSINRMLGVTRNDGGEIIAGKDRSRLLTREEEIHDRKMHGYKEGELLTAFDDLMEKWEIGGGGTTSILSVIGGWFNKYKDTRWIGSMFNKDYTKNIRNGTVENKEYYVDNVSTNLTQAQDKIFDMLTNKGSKWGDFIDAFDAEGYTVRAGGKRLTISDMSLHGVTEKNVALEKLNNTIEFAQHQKQDSFVHMLNTMRKKISTEQEADIRTVLSELNPSGIPISKNYEAILLQTFSSSANNREGGDIINFAFSTAKSLNPDSAVDFKSPATLLSLNRKTAFAKRALHNTEKFQKRADALLEEIENSNEMFQSAIQQVEGKWGIHMHSTHNISTKFVKPTDDTLFLVPEGGSFFPSFTKPDALGNSFLKNSIGSSGHIMLSSMETFNKAMGTMGLGIDNYRSSTEFMRNYFKKRILPIGGLIAGMDILDRVTDQNPLFNNTPLKDGVYQVGANAYAGTRLASAGLMDSLGITTVAKYMEDLFPGSINSPLSGAARGFIPPIAGAMMGFSKFGPAGGITGGIIGSAVSAITAGGPLALFDDWDISKDRAQVLAELKGEALVNVKKGRFWEMGSGHFWGNQTNYFRPHMFALMKSDYKDSPNFKASIFDEIASYVDPSAYNRRHYFSRPSPEHPGILSNIPIIGSIIGMPNTSEHQDVINYQQMAEDRYGYRKSVLTNDYNGSISGSGGVSDYQKIGRASGLGASQEHISNFYSEPISSSSVESRLSSAFYNIKEVAGLRGFLTEQAQAQITGNQQLFAEKPRIEANNIGSMNRQFWDLNLGGMGGLCIAEDSFVKTNLEQKQIKDIKIDDFVFTDNGFHKVIGINKRKLNLNENALIIKGELGTKIESTKNHIIPILRRHSYKNNNHLKEWNKNNFDIKEIPAEEIKVGDYLFFPINKTESNSLIDLKNYSKVFTNNYVYSGCSQDFANALELIENNPNITRKELRLCNIKDQYAKEALRSYKCKNKIQRINRFIEITEELSYCIGWYIAEGNIDDTRIQYTMHSNEEQYAQRILNTFIQLGFTGSYKIKNNTLVLKINCSILAKYFSIFGTSSYNKHIPIEYKNLPLNHLKNLIEGLVLGDGWESLENDSRKRKGFTSVSKQLVKDLAECLLKLKIPCNLTVDYVEKVKENTFYPQGTPRKNTKRNYLEYTLGNRFPWKFFNNSFLVRVNEIEEIKTDKFYYDLEIENHHYFTVDGILVHNSEGIRRIFSRKTGDISYWNPIRNTMPNWIPGNEYYIDIKHGDPYSKIEMGEARLPGESYRALYNVDIRPGGEGSLLGVADQEALNYYAGNLEVVIPRFNAEDQISKKRTELINELKGLGSLVKEQSIAYDIKHDITAQSEGMIELASGEIVPISVAPMVKGKFLSGATSGINAYLALSGKQKGLLIGIDPETGQTSEAIVKVDIEKYKAEAGRDYEIRQKAVRHMERLQSSGTPVSEGMSYSHLDRLRILGDVAYYSNNFKNELKIVKEQSKAGLLSPAEEAQVDVILEEVDAKKQKFLFKNRRFSNSGTALTRQGQLEQEAVDANYNVVEKGLGSLWENVTYLRNPITSRFIGNRDALQAYEEDVVYGQEFKQWQTPIDSYVKPFFNKMAQENNPVQAGLSGSTAGFIFGGPMGAVLGGAAGSVYSATIGQMVHSSGWVPDEVKKQREIMMAADIAEHQRYRELYDATGYNEYKYRMRNTITDALEINQPLTVERIAKIANKPDKYYVRQILSGVTTDNIKEARRLLSPEITALMDRSLGGGTNAEASDFAGGYNIDPDEVSNYDRPIEDIVVKTFQREGLDFHKVGLGWNDTTRRMAMEERLSGPISGMNSSESPERNLSARVNGSHIKRQLQLVLKQYNAQVSLESNNGPVNITIELI